MNEEELSAAVTELQATNKSLQSQRQLIRLQMEEMTLALRSLAQQMGATTYVLDGLAGGSELRNSDLVLVGFRSDGSHQASLDPRPPKQLEEKEEAVGGEEEYDDVDENEDTDGVTKEEFGQLEVVAVETRGVAKLETTDKWSRSTVSFTSPQISQALTRLIAIHIGSDLSQISGEQIDRASMTTNKVEKKADASVLTSFEPVRKLEVWERPPPWPPPSRLIGERWQSQRVTTRKKDQRHVKLVAASSSEQRYWRTKDNHCPSRTRDWIRNRRDIEFGL